MYCPKCGSTNEESAAFCTTCGADLRTYKEQWSDSDDDADQTTSEEGTTPNPAQQPYVAPSSYPPPYQQQYQPGYQSPPPYENRGYQGQGYQGQGYQQPGYQQGGYQQGGAPYPPAGYQQHTYPPGYNQGIMPDVPSYLGWAIATIFAFWPLAIVAIVYATKVGNLLSLGDVRGAQEASRKAKMWCWIAFAVGVAEWIIVIVVIAVLATAGTAVYYY